MAEFASNDPLAIQEVGHSEQIEANALGFPREVADDQLGGQGNNAAIGDANLDQADATILVGLQVWSSHSLWRIAAGWSAVCGVLSMGLLTNLLDWQSLINWQMLVLTLLLVDPLWGSIWRFAWGRDGLLPLNTAQNASNFWLPYLKPDSPAGRLLGIAAGTESRQESGPDSTDNRQSGVSEAAEHNPEKDEDFAPTLFRVGLPTVLVSIGIAATLHSAAVWLTLIVVVCSVFGWLGRRTWGNPNTLLQVIVSILLPWILAMYLLQDQLSQDQLLYTSFERRQFYSLCLVGLWTIHCLGIALARRRSTIEQGKSLGTPGGDRNQQFGAIERHRPQPETASSRLGIGGFGEWIARFSRQPAGPMLIVADVGMIVLILVLREPLWLAILAPLWLPTWLAYHHGEPVDRQPVWRLAAFIISAIAIGQAPLT